MAKKLNNFNKKLDEVKKHNISKINCDQRKAIYLQIKKEKIERERKLKEEQLAALEGK